MIHTVSMDVVSLSRSILLIIRSQPRMLQDVIHRVSVRRIDLEHAMDLNTITITMCMSRRARSANIEQTKSNILTVTQKCLFHWNSNLSIFPVLTKWRNPLSPFDGFVYGGAPTAMQNRTTPIDHTSFARASNTDFARNTSGDL